MSRSDIPFFVRLIVFAVALALGLYVGHHYGRWYPAATPTVNNSSSPGGASTTSQ